jgi:V8-like Glu-specific endopeptidase
MEQSHGEHSLSRKSFTLLHKITTTNGNSGGPLFVGREGGPIAIAIHKGKKKNMNGARLISEDLLGRVLKWEK